MYVWLFFYISRYVRVLNVHTYLCDPLKFFFSFAPIISPSFPSCYNICMYVCVWHGTKVSTLVYITQVYFLAAIRVHDNIQEREIEKRVSLSGELIIF